MTDASVALYDGRCQICQELILADIDRVTEVDGAWCHEGCVKA